MLHQALQASSFPPLSDTKLGEFNAIPSLKDENAHTTMKTMDRDRFKKQNTHACLLAIILCIGVAMLQFTFSSSMVWELPVLRRRSVFPPARWCRPLCFCWDMVSWGWCQLGLKTCKTRVQAQGEVAASFGCSCVSSAETEKETEEKRNNPTQAWYWNNPQPVWY